MRIAVVYSDVGSPPAPDDMDTIVQKDTVVSLLSEHGHDVFSIPVQQPLRHTLERLERNRIELVFNLVETLGGSSESAYLLPSALEQAAIPFTGAGSQAVLLTGNKLAAKRLMRSFGVSTPAWEEGVTDFGTSSSEREFLPGLYIIKSVWEDGSHGLDSDSVLFFTERSGVHRAIGRKQRALGGAWFGEAYVSGREFCVGVIEVQGEPMALPTYEICYQCDDGAPWLVDYAAKWDESSYMAIATPRQWEFSLEDRILLKRMEDTALDCWRFFHLAGYARIDMRVDADGMIQVFDVNANPCLSLDAGFAAQLERAGLGLERGLECIVDAALHRHGAPFTSSPSRKAA